MQDCWHFRLWNDRVRGSKLNIVHNTHSNHSFCSNGLLAVPTIGRISFSSFINTSMFSLLLLPIRHSFKRAFFNSTTLVFSAFFSLKNIDGLKDWKIFSGGIVNDVHIERCLARSRRSRNWSWTCFIFGLIYNISRTINDGSDWGKWGVDNNK